MCIRDRANKAKAKANIAKANKAKKSKANKTKSNKTKANISKAYKYLYALRKNFMDSSLSDFKIHFKSCFYTM